MLPNLLRRTTIISHRALSSACASPSSWLSTPGNPLMRWPSPPDPDVDPSMLNLPCQVSQPSPPRISFGVEGHEDDTRTAAAASTIVKLLRTTTDTCHLDSALLRCGVSPSAPIVTAVLRAGDLPSVVIVAIYRWARPHLNPTLFVSFIDLLAKSRAFDSAWSILLEDAPRPLSAFAALFRRYARTGMPSAAIRVFEYVRRHPEDVSPEEDDDAFELLIDALCKEGYPRVAAEFLDRTRKEVSAAPSVRVYNMLLHGWFRSRKLRKAELLWDQMRREGVRPTVVTYGTLIEGLCRMRRPEQAITLLEEMRAAGIVANPVTCNPIIDALSENGRFKDALGMLEKLPLYGVSPNISTFNSLVKGACKNGDLAGASNVLKMMIGRNILPSVTTYNYFFRFFSKFGKIEEGMNLYTKMIHLGYSPDRLTYQLLIKMLCEKERLELAVQLIGEMSRNGFDLDLDTSTMLVHLLCRMRRFEEASFEFESMIKRGIVPQYITYQMVVKELKRSGMLELERKVSDLMKSVRHSVNLPDTYRERKRDCIFERRNSIIKKAEKMSDALRIHKDSKESIRLKSSNEIAMESASKLITDIRRRVYAVQSYNIIDSSEGSEIY
ncbi:hypothetical protein Cni_G29240 [Canna indica]|uniref:Pentatricopeptide repeat-containing protein n=1 Tax=Canna indica TaxID=4628 RepID=A0AAQ3L5H8_9LILI|nr:hypothetical protein Cni_G29240 [Canna indica]